MTPQTEPSCAWSVPTILNQHIDCNMYRQYDDEGHIVPHLIHMYTFKGISEVGQFGSTHIRSALQINK